MLNPEDFDNRSRLNRVGFYLLMLVCVGVGLATIAYLMHMQLLGWTLNSGAVSAGRISGQKVHLVLYRSEPTARFMASVGGNADALVKPWKEYAREHAMDISERSTLDGLSPVVGDVLVLPSVVALGQNEREAILRYRSQGGNVLTTWATGSRDAEGQWVGWSFLRALAQVTVVGELPARDAGQVLVVRGQTPLTHGLLAGKSIGLGKAAERPMLLTAANIAAQAPAGYSNEVATEAGLLAFHEFGREDGVGSSRVVVLGVSETGWEYQRQDMHTLITDVLGWLSGQAVVKPSDWPNGQRAALMVAVNAQDNLPAAVNLIRQFKAAGQPASVYVSSDQARANGMALRQLRNVADLGYQGDSPKGFKGQLAEVQSQRIRRMVDEMSAMLGGPDRLKGFQAPDDSFDATTDQLLYEMGIRYRLGNGVNTQGSMPFYQGIPGEKPGQRFVVLPHLETRGAISQPISVQTDVNQLREAMTSMTRTIRLNGTLGVLSVSASSDLINGGDLKHGWSGGMAQSSKNEATEVWRATGADIAHWWREKERFRIRVRPAAARLDLDVSVVGEGDFSGGALLVMLPRKGALPAIRGLIAGTPIPTVKLLDDFRALVQFDVLPVGNYGFQLTF